MSKLELIGRSEILGTFVGHDEVQAALEGSRSDRAAMARRISSSGYNTHLSYVRDDVGARRKRPPQRSSAKPSRIIGSRVADFQHRGLYFKIQQPNGNFSNVPADKLDPDGIFEQAISNRGLPISGVYKIV